MPEPSILLRDTGDNDLAIANAAHRLRGRPASKLRWTCQHSCAEETIPGCTDMNCEAMLVLDEADARLIRAVAEQGDLAPFDAVTLTCRIAAPEPLVAALLEFGVGLARAPAGAAPSGSLPAHDLRGSVLAFARCCARIAASPEVVPGLKPLGALLAQKLYATYWVGARALLDQRFVDLRTARAPKCPLLVLAARGEWPGAAYVAFGTDTGGSTTGYDIAYGLDYEQKGAPRFGRVSPGASREPGELYGPDCRLVARVDPVRQAEARAIAERFAAMTAPADAADRCLDCFAAIARALALEIPAPPLPAGTEGVSPTLRPARFVRALIDRIPI